MYVNLFTKRCQESYMFSELMGMEPPGSTLPDGSYWIKKTNGV